MGKPVPKLLDAFPVVVVVAVEVDVAFVADVGGMEVVV